MPPSSLPVTRPLKISRAWLTRPRGAATTRQQADVKHYVADAAEPGPVRAHRQHPGVSTREVPGTSFHGQASATSPCAGRLIL